MDSLLQILKRLNDCGVDYILVGGMAAVAHGSPMMTRDVDICAPLAELNLSKILNALRGIHPKFRMRPDRMPLFEEPERLAGIKNLYLVTDLGQIDILGELPEICHYAELANCTVEMNLGGFTCRVLDLDTLIAAKKAAGRDKDIIGVRHLEAIKKTREQNPSLFDGPSL